LGWAECALLLGVVGSMLFPVPKAEKEETPVNF